MLRTGHQPPAGGWPCQRLRPAEAALRIQTGRNLRMAHRNLARRPRCAGLHLSKQTLAVKTFEYPMQCDCLHLQAGSARHPQHSMPRASSERPGWGRGNAALRPPPNSSRLAGSDAEASRSSHMEPYWLTTTNLRRLGPGFGTRCFGACTNCLTAWRQQAELLWLCKGASGLYLWRPLSQV